MISTSGLIGNFGQANYAAAKLAIVALSKSIALDMQRFNVSSNAIGPFAWTRMVGSIPTETPEQVKRVEGLKKLVPEKIAPFIVALGGDAGADVTGSDLWHTQQRDLSILATSSNSYPAHIAGLDA